MVANQRKTTVARTPSGPIGFGRMCARVTRPVRRETLGRRHGDVHARIRFAGRVRTLAVGRLSVRSARACSVFAACHAPIRHGRTRRDNTSHTSAYFYARTVSFLPTSRASGQLPPPLRTVSYHPWGGGLGVISARGQGRVGLRTGRGGSGSAEPQLMFRRRNRPRAGKISIKKGFWLPTNRFYFRSHIMTVTHPASV